MKCHIPLWSAMILLLCCNLANGQLLKTQPAERQQRLKLISQIVSAESPLIVADCDHISYPPACTTEATALSHALGADCIQLSTVLSRDGVAVVLPNMELQTVTDVATVFPDRNTNGQSFAWDFTLAELQRLQVTAKPAGSEPSASQSALDQFRIATLSQQIHLIEGLNRARRRDVGLCVRITSPAEHRSRGLDITQQVLLVLSDAGYRDASDRVFVQCHDDVELLRMRVELKCRLPLTQLITRLPSEEALTKFSRIADVIGADLAVFGDETEVQGAALSEFVRNAHQHALMVHVRCEQTSANNENSSTNPIACVADGTGVDGVLTTQPDVLLNWRTENKGQPGYRGPFHLLRNRAPEP